MISENNLDKRICDDIDGSKNTQTYREYIRDSEEQFGLEEYPLDNMNDFDLLDHLEFLDYLWTK